MFAGHYRYLPIMDSVISAKKRSLPNDLIIHKSHHTSISSYNKKRIMLWTLNIMLWALNIMLWALNIMLWALNIMLWALHIMLWTLHIMLWALHIMLWSLHIMLWALHIMLWSLHIMLWTLRIMLIINIRQSWRSIVFCYLVNFLFNLLVSIVCLSSVNRKKMTVTSLITMIKFTLSKSFRKNYNLKKQKKMKILLH